MGTVRKLATAAAVSLALASTSSLALTLGDIEMRSALNQPMNAEIRLTPSSPNEIDGMIVKLASQENFLRAGIERTAALNDLSFVVDQNAAGSPVIRISSSRPILEPFLNFLLEVDWPQGRMVREYTVLLDPPVFMSPDNSQRSTLSDNTLTRANESSVVPAPIQRSGDSGTFDIGSVEVLGSGEEVADSLVVDQGDFSGGTVVELGGDEIISADSSIVSLEGESVDLGGGEIIGGGEIVDLGSADISGGSFSADASGGEIVQLGGESVALFEGGESVNLDAGELVVLDGGLEAGTDLGGEIVTLTDSDAAVDLDFSAVDFSTETIGEFDVQVVGDTNEVGNDVGVLVSNSGIVSEGETVDLTGDGSSSTRIASGGEVAVTKNDTLWEIAEANRVGGLTTQQMMLALLDANQQAFINGNINLVKEGAILRIPDASEAAGVSQSQAVAEVAQQEQLWREYRDGARGVVGTRNAASQQPSQSQDSDADSDAGSDAVTRQEILDQARERLQESRNELKLVGENESTDLATSTSADETDQPETQNRGELNRKLQLAREELASTRLQSEELSSRDEELQGTAENMDALVTLRQDEVAKLEQQLADARRASSESVDAAIDTDAGGDAVDALDEVELFDEQENDAAATGAGADAENQAADTEATTDAARVVQPVQNTEQAEAGGAWYENLLGDKNKLLIGGVGLLALLGLLFTMFRRRGKKEDPYDAFDEDDVEFLDETGAQAAYSGEADEIDVDGGADHGAVGGAAIAAGGTAAAAAAGVAASNFSGEDETRENADIDTSVQQDASEIAANDGGDLDESVSADDTVSEADVYLAYGLHGQAEDLLNKAIEQSPDKAEYHYKLMQTYHAQGNAEGFDTAAQRYHGQFGGESAPSWEGVAQMGKEISPANVLYGETSVESVGRGDINAPKLDDDDFNLDGTGSVESSGRDFSDGSDETALMDQSIDPGAAFAESDLEATGDFTQIANEIKGGSTDTLEFPDSLSDSKLGDAGDMLGDAGTNLGEAGGNLTDGLTDGLDGLGDKAGSALDGAKSSLGGAAAGVAGLAGAGAAAVGLSGGAKADSAGSDDILEFDTDLTSDLGGDIGGDLGADLTDSTSSAAADLTSSADDLTMDLDQLSGDLEMDSNDLLNGDSDLTSDLEIPDLTSNSDLTSDASAAFGNADEMDTMMDLAKAYIDMGDKDSASSALGEIVKSGNAEQKNEAETLLRKIS